MRTRDFLDIREKDFHFRHQLGRKMIVTVIFVQVAFQRIDLEGLRPKNLFAILIQVLHQQAFQLVNVGGFLPETLLHDKAHVFQAVFRHLGTGVRNHRLRHGLADQDYFHLFLVAGIGHRLAQYLRVRETQLIRDKRPHPVIEVTGPDQVVAQEKARHDGKENDHPDISRHDLLALFV